MSLQFFDIPIDNFHSYWAPSFSSIYPRLLVRFTFRAALPCDDTGRANQ